MDGKKKKRRKVSYLPIILTVCLFAVGMIWDDNIDRTSFEKVLLCGGGRHTVQVSKLS